mmetsp:Transcript_28009/g.73939  ORF Transcript_28009/g.73939 Transcript_28009/m.73939 type:complete len:313 (+) Transcript_28009:1068-2006(+)
MIKKSSVVRRSVHVRTISGWHTEHWHGIDVIPRVRITVQAPGLVPLHNLTVQVTHDLKSRKEPPLGPDHGGIRLRRSVISVHRVPASVQIIGFLHLAQCNRNLTRLCGENIGKYLGLEDVLMVSILAQLFCHDIRLFDEREQLLELFEHHLRPCPSNTLLHMRSVLLRVGPFESAFASNGFDDARHAPRPAILCLGSCCCRCCFRDLHLEHVSRPNAQTVAVLQLLSLHDDSVVDVHHRLVLVTPLHCWPAVPFQNAANGDGWSGQELGQRTKALEVKFVSKRNHQLHSDAVLVQDFAHIASDSQALDLDRA